MIERAIELQDVSKALLLDNLLIGVTFRPLTTIWINKANLVSSLMLTGTD